VAFPQPPQIGMRLSPVLPNSDLEADGRARKNKSSSHPLVRSPRLQSHRPRLGYPSEIPRLRNLSRGRDAVCTGHRVCWLRRAGQGPRTASSSVCRLIADLETARGEWPIFLSVFPCSSSSFLSFLFSLSSCGPLRLLHPPPFVCAPLGPPVVVVTPREKERHALRGKPGLQRF